MQCAEFVPSLIEHDVPGVRTVTEQKVARMLTFVGARQPEVTEHFHGLMIDRSAFDRMLAHEAAWNGAECRYGETVLSVDVDGTVTTSAGDQLAAAGADWRRRSALAGRRGDWADQSRSGRYTASHRATILPHDATDIFLSPDYRGGYGWLFPKGAVANVGLGVTFEARRFLKPMLAALCEKLANERRIGTRTFDLTGGAIPVGGRLRSVGHLGRPPCCWQAMPQASPTR